MKTMKVLVYLLVLALAVTLPVFGGAQSEEAADLSGGEIADPIPYPDAPPMAGMDAPDQRPLDQILTYKALPSYSQPAFMDAFVADGTIPPVEERLPREPQVLLAEGMRHGLGEYGGVYRYFSAVPTEGWNIAAGQTQGWFGINYAYQESLVSSGYITRRSDSAEPFPNLAKSWEWSDDGYELTMNLIEGARWSDGDMFDADDVMFTWEDMILDPNVNSWTQRSSWQIDGEDVTLEKVDQWTVKWTFPVQRPVYMLFQMDFLDFSVAPRHVLMPEHPRYNDAADYVSFENSMPPQDLPAVTMGPWVPVVYRTDEFLVMRRNPYYWKVDESGQQLPYLHEHTFEKGSSGMGRTLGAMAGSIDQTNLENPSSFVEVTTRASEDDAPFLIEWGPEMLTFPLQVNLSATLGVNDERDAALRELFRDVRFRRALQHAIDGEGLAQAVVRGPFLRAAAPGLYPGSLYYDRESVVFYPYDPASARTLLAQIGLVDSDGDGIVNWTEGPMEGENLVIQVISHEDQQAAGQVAEGLVALFNQIGIQLNYRPVKSTVGEDMLENGEWEMRVTRASQEFAVPYTRTVDLGPLTSVTPGWHREGAEPRQLLPFEEEIVDVVNEFRLEPDFNRRKELMFEYNRLFTENVYFVGTVMGRYGQLIHKRIKNWPVGTPVFFYQWAPSTGMMEQFWVEPDEQKPETQPGTIPIH